MNRSFTRSALAALLAAGAALFASAPASHAASGVVKADADLALIPPVFAFSPATKCPTAATVQINGRRIGNLPTTANSAGICAIRGLAPVSLSPGTTVLFSATGRGVWPVFALRTVMAAPVSAS